MANYGPDLPYSTPWRRYQMPFTRLELGKGISEEAMVGPWNHPSGTSAMDVFVNDDAFFTFATGPDRYRFAMTDDASGDFIGAGASHWVSNEFWINGGKGLYTGTDKKMRLGKPVNDKDFAGKACINVVTADTDSAYYLAKDTESRVGNKVELITVEPGLHIAFATTNKTAYATNDYYDFTLDYDYLRQLPKEYNGVWSCWMYVPIDSGEYTYSHDLPSELNIRGFNIYLNPMRIGPKQKFTDISAIVAKDFGLTGYVISKPKGEAWLGEHVIPTPFPSSPVANQTVKEISTDIDFSIGDLSRRSVAMHHSATHQGGERQDDLRIELRFNDTTVNTAEMIAGQYIQVVIVPQ